MTAKNIRKTYGSVWLSAASIVATVLLPIDPALAQNPPRRPNAATPGAVARPPVRPPSRPVELLPPLARVPASRLISKPPVAPTETAAPIQAPDATCTKALIAAHGRSIRVAEPAKVQADPLCTVVEPVVVEALTLRHGDAPGEIVLQPPATLSCAMATTLTEWLDIGLQPLARGHFGREIKQLRVGGGHECRRRNRASTGPLSEHSTGRALDIFAFVFAPDKPALTVVVEKPDGVAQERFLQAVRQSACGAFATSIGPGADAAHANHLHLDIQVRRAASTRFCQ